MHVLKIQFCHTVSIFEYKYDKLIKKDGVP